MLHRRLQELLRLRALRQRVRRGAREVAGAIR
jgi:hypothetical protein